MFDMVIPGDEICFQYDLKTKHQSLLLKRKYSPRFCFRFFFYLFFVVLFFC